METLKGFNHWLSSSITVKLLSIGFLILVLLVPKEMIHSLITERQLLNEQVVQEISAQWGGGQTITGPFLIVPYRTYIREDGKLKENGISNAYLLPDDLEIKGTVNPETRYRGIYKQVVYNASLEFIGTFSKPDWTSLGIEPESIMKNEITLALGIPDMRGIQKTVDMLWGNQKCTADPGLRTHDVAESGLSMKVKLDPFLEADSIHFKIPLSLNGSGTLNFIPVGKQTRVEISSPWKDPSFEGSFLPHERTISENGFTAHWSVLHLNRNFPQQWIGKDFDLNPSSFGVSFLVPVDHYQKATRSIKYALMFIALTFTVFFFVEVVNKRRIHPIQYLFVGIGLTIFYSLLVSLSEHLSFNVAFLIAAVCIICMISLYTRAIFRSTKLAMIMLALLTFLYGFLFIILQLQDYALLLGSIGLFVVLAIIMYLSRNINWFEPIGEKEESGQNTQTE
jgi:inner membrane protein